MLGVFAGKAITVFNGFVRFDHPSGFVCLNPQIPSFPVSVYSGSLGLIKLISEGLQNG